MKKNNKVRRRTLIVNPTLQQRLIRDVIKVPIVSLVIGTVVVMGSFWLIMQGAKEAKVELPGIYGLLVSLVGLVFILSCVVTLKTAVRLSNRIAGPLHRLHQSMEQAMQGDTRSRVSFRDDDYLKETADVYNKLLSHLEENLPISPHEKDGLEQAKERDEGETAIPVESELRR